jgi:hypothetical protein
MREHSRGNTIKACTLRPTTIRTATVLHYDYECLYVDQLCGLVVRVPGYRSRGTVSIPGATRFSEK